MVNDPAAARARAASSLKARGDVDEFDYEDDLFDQKAHDELQHEIEESEKMHKELEDEVHRSEEIHKAGLYKLNPVDPYGLKAPPGFTPLAPEM